MAATIDLVMPKLGLTMTEGTLVEWKVALGAAFAVGEILFVVETDKIATEVEAPAAGQLTEMLIAKGTTVAVGTPVGRYTTETAAAEIPSPKAAPIAAPQPEPAAPQAVTRRDGARVIATPRARRLARDQGIDLAALTGSGPGGRIKAADVEAYRPPAPAMAPPEILAPMVLVDAFDPTALIALHRKLKKPFPAFLVLAVGRAFASGRIAFERGGRIDMTVAARRGLTAIAEADFKTEATDLLVIDVGKDGPAEFRPSVDATAPIALAFGRAKGERAPFTLVADPKALGHEAAFALARRLRDLLSDPLRLLL
ncbi:MAG: hypothetical protein FJX47_03140 [Alphaproteobacteria bacterium]|nr:hypothetical protein [Alphaproteobacteria bacterium]